MVERKTFTDVFKCPKCGGRVRYSSELSKDLPANLRIYSCVYSYCGGGVSRYMNMVRVGRKPIKGQPVLGGL